MLLQCLTLLHLLFYFCTVTVMASHNLWAHSGGHLLWRTQSTKMWLWWGCRKPGDTHRIHHGIVSCFFFYMLGQRLRIHLIPLHNGITKALVTTVYKHLRMESCPTCSQIVSSWDCRVESPSTVAVISLFVCRGLNVKCSYRCWCSTVNVWMMYSDGLMLGATSGCIITHFYATYFC